LLHLIGSMEKFWKLQYNLQNIHLRGQVICDLSSNKVQQIQILSPHPQLLAEIVGQIANLTLPPPPSTFKINLKTLHESMNDLFESSTHSDFIIQIENTPIKVHKCVLGLKWKYFESIMLHDESGKEHHTDLPLSTFKKLIKFFYTGDVSSLNFVDCGWLSSLSEYYLIEDKFLLEFCDKVINSQITQSNWYEALQLSNWKMKK